MTKLMPSPKQLHEESWTFHALPPNPSVAAVTRRQHATGAHTPAPSHIAISPQFTADDLLTLQNANSSLRTMAAHMSDPLEHPISSTDLNTSSELRTLHYIKHMLHLRDGVLAYVPEPLTAKKLIVSHGQRGIILTHAHDAPCAGHHGVKATYEKPKQVAYWPDIIIIIITLFLYSAFKTVSQSTLHNKTSENPTHTRQLIKTKIKLKLNSQEKANPKK